jgi:hypothetical protein
MGYHSHPEHDPDDDSPAATQAEELKRLYQELLTDAQRDALDLDVKNPRWDLDPPQREEYSSDYGYTVGLGEYADRLIAAKKP